MCFVRNVHVLGVFAESFINTGIWRGQFNPNLGRFLGGSFCIGGGGGKITPCLKQRVLWTLKKLNFLTIFPLLWNNPKLVNLVTTALCPRSKLFAQKLLKEYCKHALQFFSF